MTPPGGTISETTAMEFREWTDGDIASVREVTWTTWVDAYSSYIPAEDLRSYFDLHYSTEALQHLYRNPDVRGFLALIDGRPAGVLRSFVDRGEGRFYVSSLYVLPEHQGKGLGNRLMTMAENRALECGMDKIWLGVMSQNFPALDWYRRHGFTFVEELPFSMGRTTVQHLIGFRKIGRSQDRPVSTTNWKDIP